MEEWCYYLQTGIIPDSFTAPGLPEARERLQVDHLSKDERKVYERYTIDRAIGRDVMETAKREGYEIGYQIGRDKSITESKKRGREGVDTEIARNLKSIGLPIPDIVKATGLSQKEVEAL